MDLLPYRKTSRETSIRTRFKSLTSIEQTKLRFLKKCALINFARYKREIHPQKRALLKKRILVCLAMSIGIKADTYEEIEAPVRAGISLESMTDMFSKEFLRFRKEDLRRLFNLLNFPEKVVLDNRSTMTGEEVFMRGLYELTTGAKKTMVAETFGRHPSDQCRAFNYFIKHIYDGFHHLVINNLSWWERNGLLERSAIAIEEKLGGHFQHRYVGFIDCNCLRTDRPGGGPLGDGPGSLRWSNDVQRSFYNGWKSIHGLKHQTVDNALGFVMDVYGPVPLRGNDMSLFRDSRINERMENLGEWCIFGDSAYRHHSRTHSYGVDGDFNGKMKSVRISIEWNYGTTASLFTFIGMKRKFKVYETAGVARIYIVATLLKNFHACLYGNQTMNYFNVVLQEDFLECYISSRNIV